MSRLAEPQLEPAVGLLANARSLFSIAFDPIAVIYFASLRSIQHPVYQD